MTSGSRRLRVGRPPRTDNPALDAWLDQVADAINGVPDLTIVSGNPNTSGITGGVGTLAVNILSSATQRVWVNVRGTSSGWSWLTQN